MTNRDPGATEYQYDWQNPNKTTFDFGRVIGRAFTGLFANIRPILIALVIILVLTSFFSILSSNQIKSLFGETNAQAMVSDPSFWLWTYGASVPALFLTLWLQLIVVETSYANFTNTSQPQSPLTSSLKYVLPMFVVAIIYSIVSIIGFYALVIGFLFVWPGWALAGPVLVHEKAGIFGSIGRAWNLSKGSKRWIFLLLFVLGIISMIIYGVVMGIATTITGVNILAGDPTATFNLSAGQQVLFNSVVGIGGYFVYALFASALTAAYVEVKTMKDGSASVGDVFS